MIRRDRIRISHYHLRKSSNKIAINEDNLQHFNVENQECSGEFVFSSNPKDLFKNIKEVPKREEITKKGNMIGSANSIEDLL